MPWRVRWQVYMILLGVAALVIGIIVMARHKSLDSELLAALGIVGGLAIILNALPRNGNGHGERDYRDRDRGRGD